MNEIKELFGLMIRVARLRYVNWRANRYLAAVDKALRQKEKANDAALWYQAKYGKVEGWKT